MFAAPSWLHGRTEAGQITKRIRRTGVQSMLSKVQIFYVSLLCLFKIYNRPNTKKVLGF